MKRTAARPTASLALILLAFVGAILSVVGSDAQAQSPVFSSSSPVGRPYTQPSRMLLADFDADGNADLATVGYVNGDTSNANGIYLQIYLGDGQGGFAASPSAFTLVNDCSGVKGLATLGLDSNGNLNLALLCTDTLQIWHVPHDPAAASSGHPPITLPNDLADRQAYLLDTAGVAMAVTDLVGSGGAGIAVLEAGQDGAKRAVEYFPPGPGCSTDCSSSGLQLLAANSVKYDFGDWVSAEEHGTGLVAVPQPADVSPVLVVVTSAIGSCGGSIVPLLLTQSDGFSFSVQPVTSIPAGYCASAVATGDYSQQGGSALAVSGVKTNGTGFLSVYQGVSGGAFTAPDLHTESVYPPIDDSGLAMLDLNGDGNADVVVGGIYGQGQSSAADTVSIYLGNGDGTVTFAQTPGPNVSGTNPIGLGTGVGAVASGNLNADGAPDLAAIDGVGDGSGGGVGNVQPLVGSLLQTFPTRDVHSSVSLTAISSIGLGGPDPGPVGGSIPVGGSVPVGGLTGGRAVGRAASNLRQHAADQKAQLSGSVTSTLLSAFVLPSDATGWVQFFDATTQSWIGSAQFNSGEADLTVYAVPGHRFTASYYGSASYIGSTSAATVAVAGKTDPGISLFITPDPALPTDTVTLDASLYGNAGTPTGLVNFIDQNTSTVLATATVGSGGDAAVTISNLAVGSYDLVASYAGDNQYNAAVSGDTVLTVAVPLVPVTVSLTATPTVLAAGSTISATANLLSNGNATPTGTVAFQLDGTSVATATISSGVASATFIASAGKHRLQALYAGDGTSAPADSNTVFLTVHGGLVQFLPGVANIVAGVPATDNTGNFSGDGGPAVSAQLHTPFGLAFDNGSLYIADEQNNVIRKVAPDGSITTVAGSPYVGNIYTTRYSGDGGSALRAYLSNPSAMVFDRAGNMFIADYSNNVVRRVDAVTGIITTYAGNNSASSSTLSGPATSIGLSNPVALAMDAADNLYIADDRNSLVRKVDPTGYMTTVAGHYGYSGGPSYGLPATSSTLDHPQGLAVDAVGNLYIADTNRGVVSKVDVGGTVTLFAGGYTGYATNLGDGGPAINATLNIPTQLSVNAAGELFITDVGNSVIRKVDVNGIITTVAGSKNISGGNLYDPAGTPATSAPLSAPGGVVIDTAGDLLISDTGDQTVWRVGPAGAVVFGPQAPGTTSAPQFITLENVGDAAVNFQATPFTVTGDYLVSSEGIAPCNLSAALAVGATCTIAVRYRPATGALRGSIVFATVNSGSPTITLQSNTTPLTTVITLQLSSTVPEIGQDLLIYGLASSAQNKPLPTGTFSFYDGTIALGTSPLTASNGFAFGFFDTSTLPLGDHQVTAAYSGDNLYAPATSDSQYLQVTKINTAVALTSDNASPVFGSTINFTARVTVADTAAALGMGSIVFSDGGRALATVAVNAQGIAVYSTAALSPGVHALQAQYVSQGNYAEAYSNSLDLLVGGGGGGGLSLDYAIQAAGLPVVLHRGESATIQLTVSSFGPAPGTVALNCGTLPSYASCTFSPALLTFNSNTQSQTVTWTIQTTPAPAGMVAGPGIRIGQGSLHGLPQVTARH